VHEPQLLILDEPFSGLDPVGVDTMSDVLRERAAAGIGVLFSSHQLELVEQLCDRVIISAGAIVAAGTLGELREAGDRQLELRVEAASRAWLAAVPGVDVVTVAGDLVRLRLEDPSLDQAVLAAAARAGRVIRFGWRQPTLAEIYRGTVGEA
jgi:ABC-2 type transport system ATP-binding protein